MKLVRRRVSVIVDKMSRSDQVYLGNSGVRTHARRDWLEIRADKGSVSPNSFLLLPFLPPPISTTGAPCGRLACPMVHRC